GAEAIARRGVRRQVNRMRVPVFHGLTVADLVRRRNAEQRPFPFSAPRLRYFYRARNAIYYLFRAMSLEMGRIAVLAPDYNSGNEILAMQAAGATVHYYPVGPDMQVDPSEIERLCAIHSPHVLYVTHYLGWPQPMPALVEWCR